MAKQTAKPAPQQGAHKPAGQPQQGGQQTAQPMGQPKPGQQQKGQIYRDWASI